MEVGDGGVGSEGLGFIEKRCLELSVTAAWMSENVIFMDLRRGHFIYDAVSKC